MPSTSPRPGIESCAPLFVTANAPAAEPTLTASANSRPSAKATASAPLKASPAPTESTAATSKAGTNLLLPAAVT